MGKGKQEINKKYEENKEGLDEVIKSRRLKNDLGEAQKAYKRLIKPAIDREIRSDLKEKAENQPVFRLRFSLRVSFISLLLFAKFPLRNPYFIKVSRPSLPLLTIPDSSFYSHAKTAETLSDLGG